MSVYTAIVVIPTENPPTYIAQVETPGEAGTRYALARAAKAGRDVSAAKEVIILRGPVDRVVSRDDARMAIRDLTSSFA